MMDLSGLNEFINVGVVLLCWIIGFLYKHYTKWNNKYIPCIVLIVGLVANILLAYAAGNPVTFNVCITGGISGLASTGCQEAVTRLFNFGETPRDN